MVAAIAVECHWESSYPEPFVVILRTYIDLYRPEKYTIKPARKEIAAVSIDLTRHDDFQGPRKLEVTRLELTDRGGGRGHVVCSDAHL